MTRTHGVCARGAAFLLLAGASTSASAQRDTATDAVPVCGTVRNEDGLAINAARVALVGAVSGASSVETPDDGSFCVTYRGGGAATLVVRRIGFQADTVVVVRPGDRRRLDLRLTTVPIALAPVLVHGVRELRPGPTADFYARKATGFGRYITRSDIVSLHPTRTSDLFYRIPGLALNPGAVRELRIRGAACAPELFIDGTPLGGMPFDFDALAPESIEGIEVYSSFTTVPVEFTRPFGRSACGTVIVWTREGEFRPRAPRRAKVLSSADLARLVDGSRLFTADQVDVPAAADDSFRDLLRLRDTLSVWPPAGVVTMEFVVDSVGRVAAETVNIVTSPGAIFTEAVRAALASAEFTPGMRAGRPVRQLMQLRVRFEPPPPRSR